MDLNELNRSESVCVKRCIDKFFSVLELVGTELNGYETVDGIGL